MKRPFVVLLCVVSVSEVWAQDSGLLLTVTVEDAHPNLGQVIVSLFDSENFLQTPTAQQTGMVNDEGRCTVVFHGLVSGEYAVSAIYDEDMDGELDTGLFRIPKERIGFSNNARGRFGPASYEDAKIVLSATDLVITINLVSAD